MIKQQSSGKRCQTMCTTAKRCKNLKFKNTGLAFKCSQDFKIQRSPFRDRIEVAEKTLYLRVFSHIPSAAMRN